MQKIIDEVVDQIAYEQLQKLRSEVKGAREEFERTIKAIKEYNSSLTKGASLKGAYTEMQQLAKAQRELKQSSDGLIKTNVELQRLEVQNQRLKTETARTEGVQLRNNKISNSEKEKEAKLTREVANEYKKMNATMKDAEVRYANLALAGKAQTAEAKIALKEALTIRKALEDVDRTLRRGAFDARNLSRGLGNSMQQIFRELPVLAMNSQTFFLAISNNLPIFFDAISQAKAEIKAYNADLKQGAVEAGNVAKAQALAAGATEKQAVAAGKAATAQALANTQYQKAPSLLKLLTQNLFSYQTLLIAGVTLLTVYGKDLVEWAGNLLNGSKAAKEAERAAKLFNETLKDGSYKSAIENVHTLAAEIELAKAGFLDKDKVVKHFNDTIGKTVGAVKDVYEADKVLTESGPAFIEMMFLKAQSAIAFNEAAQKAIDAQRIQKEDVGFGGTILATRNNLTALEKLELLFTQNQSRRFALTLKAQQKYREDNVKETQDEAKDLVKIAEDTMKKAAKIASDNKWDFFSGTQDEKDKRKKEDKDYTDEYVKNLELRRKAEIDFQKFLFDATGEERYRTAARDLQLKLEEELKQIRIDGVKDQAKKNEESAKVTATKLENIELESVQNRRDINIEYFSDIADARQESEKQFKDIEEEMTKIAKTESDKRKKEALNKVELEGVSAQSTLESGLRRENAQNLRLYQEGTINREQYEARKLKIQEEYEDKALLSAIQFNLNLLKLLSDDPEKQKDIWAKIEKDLEQHEKNKTRLAERGEKEREDERKKRQKAMIETLKFIQSQIQDIINRDTDNQLQEIENQSRAVEERKEKELAAIEKTSLAEKEKEELSAQIENEAAARQEALQQREIELKQRKAKYDKALAAAQTIGAGVQAFAVALTAGPIIGPILAAIVAGLVAVQLSKLYATPLPQYKDGRKGGRAELAITGEAGRERIEHLDGTKYYVDKPTLTYLPEGAKVISNAELNAEKTHKMTAESNLVVNSQGKLQAQPVMTDAQITRLEKAMKDGRPKLSVISDWRGSRFSFEKQDGFSKWIRKNI